MERNYVTVTLRIVALAFALAASVAERLLLSMTTYLYHHEWQREKMNTLYNGVE